MTLARRLVAEGPGSAFLLAIVVGSGIMGERLAGGNTAIALLANALATGAGLVALILMFGTVSGAHFNPAVTLSEAWQDNMPRRDVLPFMAVQVTGAIAGFTASSSFANPAVTLARGATVAGTVAPGDFEHTPARAQRTPT